MSQLCSSTTTFGNRVVITGPVVKSHSDAQMVAMLVLVNIPFSSFLQGLYILFLLDLIALQIYLYMNSWTHGHVGSWKQSVVCKMIHELEASMQTAFGWHKWFVDNMMQMCNSKYCVSVPFWNMVNLFLHAKHECTNGTIEHDCPVRLRWICQSTH